MGRLSFGTEGEPSTLMPVLELLSDAVTRENAVEWVVPGEAQTEAYAHAVLARWCPDDLATRRSVNRADRGRVLAEGGVRTTVFMKSRALGNLAAVGGNVTVLYDQLEYLIGVIDADTLAGEDSVLRVGIVPAGIGLLHVPPGPGGSNMSPRDAGIVETTGDTFIHGMDGYEIDAVGTQGIRGSIVAMRRLIVDEWAQNAVFGDQARRMVRQTQYLLEAAD